MVGQPPTNMYITNRSWRAQRGSSPNSVKAIIWTYRQLPALRVENGSLWLSCWKCDVFIPTNANWHVPKILRSLDFDFLMFVAERTIWVRVKWLIIPQKRDGVINCKPCWILVQKVWIRFCPLPIFHLITGVDHCDPLRTYGEITAFTGAQQNEGRGGTRFFRPDVAISHGFPQGFYIFDGFKMPKEFWASDAKIQTLDSRSKKFGDQKSIQIHRSNWPARMGWQIPFLESFLQTVGVRC